MIWMPAITIYIVLCQQTLTLHVTNVLVKEKYKYLKCPTTIKYWSIDTSVYDFEQAFCNKFYICLFVIALSQSLRSVLFQTAQHYAPVKSVAYSCA